MYFILWIFESRLGSSFLLWQRWDINLVMMRKRKTAKVLRASFLSFCRRRTDFPCLRNYQPQLLYGSHVWRTKDINMKISLSNLFQQCLLFTLSTIRLYIDSMPVWRSWFLWKNSGNCRMCGEYCSRALTQLAWAKFPEVENDYGTYLLSFCSHSGSSYMQRIT